METRIVLEVAELIQTRLDSYTEPLEKKIEELQTELTFKNEIMIRDLVADICTAVTEKKELQTKLKNEQKASTTYRIALHNIAAQAVIANTVESMVYVAKAAISVGRDQRSGK